LELKNNFNGILLAYTNNSQVIGNKIVYNEWNIFLERANNVSITNNTVMNSPHGGIWLNSTSSCNAIYHNDFIDNMAFQAIDSGTHNIWNDDYPSGGNYWNNYTGVDYYSGPYQNETSSDNIGDTPHVLDADSQDRYPFMSPLFTLVGDINGDGVVDIFDIVIVAAAFGSTLGDPNWSSDADQKPDGIIDIFDLVKVAVHFGETSQTEGSSSSSSVRQRLLRETTSISVYPGQITVYKYHIFTVNITFTGAANLYGWELKLYWNNTILNCTNAEIHVPTVWSGNTVEAGKGVENTFNATHGRYWRALSALNPASTFNGSMAIITLTFETKATGTTLLDLQETKLSDTQACAISHLATDGSVTALLPERYMRGDSHTINGLTAYKLATSQSSIAKSFSQTQQYDYYSAYWGIQVWKRNASGYETQISSGIVAQVSRTSQGQGLQSDTWNCPQTSLNPTGTIVVRVYQKIGSGNWQLAATFTTEQLGVTQLAATTWTLYYYTKLSWVYDPMEDIEITKATFYWGTTTYNSHIQNIDYN